MRFSFRTMISGALSSSRRLRRLFAVDHPAIEIVQVESQSARRPAAPAPQLGRQHRQHFHDHQSGLMFET